MCKRKLKKNHNVTAKIFLWIFNFTIQKLKKMAKKKEEDGKAGSAKSEQNVF